ncbi:MAG: PEGA domain-containing protein [Luteitalea sp.]|nr:PEGA domain-containing protein [Luteitalea sp.]
MNPKFCTVAVAGLMAAALALPPAAWAQRTRGGEPATGSAVARDPAPAPPPSSGGRSTAGSSGGDSGQPSPRAGQRSGDESRGGARARGGSGDGRSDRGRSGDAVPPYSRPRDGRNATGEAVERRPGSGGGGTIIVPGGYGRGYYPWGWGGLGFGGYGYYGGFYDPWGYDAYGYGAYQGGYASGYDGALRLKVKPRDASVFIDGYFAGVVDDYDGVFQRLHVEPGPHRVEIRSDGYEPLMFEIRIQPDRTVTYKGDLQRLP